MNENLYVVHKKKIHTKIACSQCQMHTVHIMLKLQKNRGKKKREKLAQMHSPQKPLTHTHAQACMHAHTPSAS